MISTLGYSLEQAEELVEILNTVIQQSVASEIGSCVKKVSLVRLNGWAVTNIISLLLLGQDGAIITGRY